MPDKQHLDHETEDELDELQHLDQPEQLDQHVDQPEQQLEYEQQFHVQQHFLDQYVWNQHEQLGY